MKRTILGLAIMLVVFLTVLVVLAVRPVRRVKAHRGCSDSTLMGNYGWTEFGYEPEGKPDFWTSTALVHFDGHGNFAGNNVYSIDNGAPDPDSPNDLTDGKYTVNPDCTVTITYTWEGGTYTDHGVVVGADGNEVIANEQSERHDTTGQLDMKKIADSD